MENKKHINSEDIQPEKSSSKVELKHAVYEKHYFYGFDEDTARKTEDFDNNTSNKVRLDNGEVSPAYRGDESSVSGKTADLKTEFLSLVENLDGKALEQAYATVLKATGKTSKLIPDLTKSFSEEPKSTKSIYDAREPNELVHDFIERIYSDRQMYRSKKLDGDIIPFIEKVYKDKGLMDGKLFTRSVLKKLDNKAHTALKNWLLVKDNTLSSEFLLPSKYGQSVHIVSELSIEQIRAAHSAVCNGLIKI